MRPITGLMDLTGRKALVTGGVGHIGIAVAETLLELGATISVLDLDPESSRQWGEIRSKQPENVGPAIACDLRDENATRASIDQITGAMNGLDILVHCAAYVGTTNEPGWAVPFEEQTVQAWDDAIKTNLTSVFIMVQQAQTALAESGHGSIILFSSIYGVVGPDMRLYENTQMANPAGYGASKGGLVQLTRFLSTTLAPRTRVNAISPGGVWRNQPSSFHKQYVSKTPLQRMAEEEDLKGAVAYLASDLSSYVTGHNLVVDGGWTAW